MEGGHTGGLCKHQRPWACIAPLHHVPGETWAWHWMRALPGLAGALLRFCSCTAATHPPPSGALDCSGRWAMANPVACDVQDAEGAVAMAPWQGMYALVLAVALVDGVAAVGLLVALALHFTVAAAVSCCLAVALLGMLACLLVVWVAPDEVRTRAPVNAIIERHTPRSLCRQEIGA